MTRIRESGRMTSVEIGIIITLTFAAIILAILGNRSARNAELAAAQGVNKNWQEKDCDYFGKRAIEEANGKDYEKVILYLKLHGACLDLYGIQPKTPE